MIRTSQRRDATGVTTDRTCGDEGGERTRDKVGVDHRRPCPVAGASAGLGKGDGACWGRVPMRRPRSSSAASESCPPCPLWWHSGYRAARARAYEQRRDMSDDRVLRCRCRHLWTVHLDGHCDSEEGHGPCSCRGFYPQDWQPNTTDTCRACSHHKSQYSGVSCNASIGQDTVTDRHFGIEGDTWTTKRPIEITCTCQRFS